MMQENYKGFDIKYESYDHIFTFKIDNQELGTNTVDQARRTIDNWLHSQKIIGKEIITFSAKDNKPIITTITKISISTTFHGKRWAGSNMPVASTDFSIDYYDIKEKRIRSRGPFLINTPENIKLANKFYELEKKEMQIYDEKNKLWEQKIVPKFERNFDRST